MIKDTIDDGDTEDEMWITELQMNYIVAGERLI